MVLCANHTALTDPLFVCFAAKMRYQIRPMAKIELSRVPLIGWLLGKAGVIYVDRGHADVKAVKSALACLKGEGKLLIFPEGTRVHEGEDVAAKGGVALFATAREAPSCRYMSPGKSPGSGLLRWSSDSPSIPRSRGGKRPRRSWTRSPIP